jgi:hypothetical protein
MTIPWLGNCSHSPDGWCLDCVKELGERAQAAEAIVAKLPKTADGVPIVPDMTLYAATGWGAQVCALHTFQRREFDGVTPNIEGIFDGRATSFPATRCYSTREAAEARAALAPATLPHDSAPAGTSQGPEASNNTPE